MSWLEINSELITQNSNLSPVCQLLAINVVNDRWAGHEASGVDRLAAVGACSIRPGFDAGQCRVYLVDLTLRPHLQGEHGGLLSCLVGVVCHVVADASALRHEIVPIL